MRVFISAGEASGDAYGAAFATELRKLAEVEIWAVGGPRLRAVADRLVADSSRWSAISMTQSAKVAGRIAWQWPALRRALKDGAGGLAVPIDFGFVNQRVARLAKRNGWRVLSFIPPGSWKRGGQAPWVPELCDAVSTPFEWSAKLLSEEGAKNVHWLGHPLKQLLRDRVADRPSERANQLAVLPGSRSHEWAINLPLIARCLPEIPIEFALAPGIDESKFRNRWNRLAPGRSLDRFTVGDSAGVLLRSRAGVVCSGTATLEAALCGCPMVVVYKVSRAMQLEAKLVGFKRPKFIALPNIVLDRMLVEEFVDTDAIPAKLAPFVARLLEDEALRESQLAGFAEIDRALGPDDAITQTARLAMELLGSAASR